MEIKNNTKLKSLIKRGFIFWSGKLIICLIGILLINAFVCAGVKEQIMLLEDTYKADEFGKLQELNAEYIIVPGCGIIDNSQPTHMMADRLDVAINLYHRGLAPKMLFSGDHSDDSYNEVAVMRDYAIEHGVKDEDIVLDHSGFSTSETMFRANSEFGITRAIIVTQEYHLSRSLYLANNAGINALGVCAEGHYFKYQLYYSFRERCALTKDVFVCLFTPFLNRITG